MSEGTIRVKVDAQIVVNAFKTFYGKDCVISFPAEQHSKIDDKLIKEKLTTLFKAGSLKLSPQQDDKEYECNIIFFEIQKYNDPNQLDIYTGKAPQNGRLTTAESCAGSSPAQPCVSPDGESPPGNNNREESK